MKSVTYTEIDWHEFDELVNSSLNLKNPYNFMADEEKNNDTSYTYEVDNDDLLEWDYDKQKSRIWYEWAKFLEGDYRFNIQLLLERLVLLGRLPKGKILISICY